jgi:MoaA/NifB/PqqE/SkfB family radical SAM enzyme
MLLETTAEQAVGDIVAPPLPATSSTYIMQGSENRRALDKYHLILAPTHACNLRCRHCYLPDHLTDLLPCEVALRMVDEWADLVRQERGPYGGLFHVKGGEPFVVPYIAEIFNRVIASGTLELMITTNGTILSSKVKAALTHASTELGSRFTVIVSVDGATEQTHDLLRGAGSFKMTRSFLDFVGSMGVTLHFNSVLHRENLHEIAALVTLARDVGASQVNFLPFVTKGFGEQIQHLQMPQSEVARSLHTFYQAAPQYLRKMLAGSAPDLLNIERAGEAILSHECVAAYRGLFYIKPDGSAFTCPNIERSDYSVGNVKSMTLRQLSDRLANLHRRLRTSRGDDTLICIGESLLYEHRKDKPALANLSAMQRDVLALRAPNREATREPATAYCISRNF